MFKWRIIISGKLPPAENMAIDEAVMLGIIKGNSLPTIRFYDWNKPTASFGYNQVLDDEIDLDLLKKNGFGYIRRPTGGRLVLHNEEVTYSVIAPAENQLSGNVTQSYSEISTALKEGFELMGISIDLEKGELSSQHQRESSNPCFASSSRYELKYNNKKIVGSAQVRKQSVILQHGSILLNHDQSDIASILPGLNEDQRKRVSKFLSRKTIAINNIVDCEISFHQAIQYLKSGFRLAWENDEFIDNNDFSVQEKKMIDKLISSKYSSDIWNKRK